MPKLSIIDRIVRGKGVGKTEKTHIPSMKGVQLDTLMGKETLSTKPIEMTQTKTELTTNAPNGGSITPPDSGKGKAPEIKDKPADSTLSTSAPSDSTSFGKGKAPEIKDKQKADSSFLQSLISRDKVIAPKDVTIAPTVISNPTVKPI